MLAWLDVGTLATTPGNTHLHSEASIPTWDTTVAGKDTIVTSPVQVPKPPARSFPADTTFGWMTGATVALIALKYFGRSMVARAQDLLIRKFVWKNTRR